MKKNTEVTWEILPETFDEFLSEAQNKLYDPETAAALFVCALRIYMQNRQDGTKCLNLICFNDDGSVPLYFPRLEQLTLTAKYLPDAYFRSATPENGYIHPDNTVVIKSDEKRGLHHDMKTVYIGCSGSGNFRPVTLKCVSVERVHKYHNELNPENDMWFISDYVSLLLDILPPV